MTTCKLWKITLSLLYPNDNKEERIFWAYHQREDLAKDAAKRWADVETGGAAIPSILKVDLIK